MWLYPPIESEPFPIPALMPGDIDPALVRRIVPYEARLEGVIVVDTSERFLYLTLGDGRALRYGIGVGREGFDWSGQAVVGRKAAWPRWTPTQAMIAREPRYQEWANGMEGGPENPLGARALYLHQGGRDTLYRLHGTNEPWSIGQAVSSGCVRLLNHDIIDLYERTPIGAQVIVSPSDRIASAGTR